MTAQQPRRWPVPESVVFVPTWPPGEAPLTRPVVLVDDPGHEFGPQLEHSDCTALADVMVGLDCAYCPACGLSVRIDGAWVIAQLDSDPGGDP